MEMVIGEYYNSNSWIHKLDPRVKLLSVLLFMIGLFLIDSFILIGIIFVLSNILILTSKVPYLKFLKSLKTITYLILFMFIFQVIFRTSGTLLHTFDFTLTLYNIIAIVILLAFFFISSKFIKKFRFILFLFIIFISFVLQIYFVNGITLTNYQINIYSDALTTAGFVVVRIVTIIFVSSLLSLTTKPMELNQGLESLLCPLKVFKVNPAIFSMMVSIALRFIPTLLNEANKILKAQASRGVDFKEGKLKEKVTQIISLIVPIFVIAYRRAIDLADAMEARGYDPDSKRTHLKELHMKRSDIITLSMMCLMFASIIVLKIIYHI